MNGSAIFTEGGIRSLTENDRVRAMKPTKHEKWLGKESLLPDLLNSIKDVKNFENAVQDIILLDGMKRE
jgi:hypothetical protein